MSGDDLITVYHGTYHPFDFVQRDSWVTMAREEAEGYARTAVVDNMLKGLARPQAGLPWVLVLQVQRGQIIWKDGCGDSDFDGQHGTLLIDVPVTSKTCIS